MSENGNTTAAPAILAIGVAFTEGPAATADGTVYFSDIANNRILQFTPGKQLFQVFRQPSGRANGLLFDPQGRLLACEGNEMGPNDGNRRITRTDLQSGAVEVLCDSFEGKPLNSPNDIACTSDGHIFFTDPCYGDRSQMVLDHESVIHVDPAGDATIAISQPDIQRPNGIHLSPDEKTLYIVDSSHDKGGNRKIWAFSIDENRKVSGQRLVYDFAPGRGGDGMAVDQEGMLHIAAGIHRPRGPHETTDVKPGIYRVTPSGELVGRIPILEDVLTNVTFGGADLKTMYVTAGKTLFTAQSNVPGWVVHRR